MADEASATAAPRNYSGLHDGWRQLYENTAVMRCAAGVPTAGCRSPAKASGTAWDNPGLGSHRLPRPLGQRPGIT